MDGVLTNMLHSNLNLLSELSMKRLLKYYETGTLSSQDRNLLLKEIIAAKDTSKAAHLPS
tara:strand:+ start:403 stop:582 length:180 start_codon:yes stop_codon:yes gene_type:complete